MFDVHQDGCLCIHTASDVVYVHAISNGCRRACVYESCGRHGHEKSKRGRQTCTAAAKRSKGGSSLDHLLLDHKDTAREVSSQMFFFKIFIPLTCIALSRPCLIYGNHSVSRSVGYTCDCHNTSCNALLSRPTYRLCAHHAPPKHPPLYVLLRTRCPIQPSHSSQYRYTPLRRNPAPPARPCSRAGRLGTGSRTWAARCPHHQSPARGCPPATTCCPPRQLVRLCECVRAGGEDKWMSSGGGRCADTTSITCTCLSTHR